MIEESKGSFPLWLSPVQVCVIPVNNEYHLEYSNSVIDKLNANHIRCYLDNRDEKLSYKMRESQTKKIPYTLVLGDKERDNNQVSYRLHGENDTKTISVDEFIKLIKDQIINKK